jgi:Tfp pilus assembly protein PilF
MGIAYQLMFDNTDALRCYLAALKREPNNSATLNNLGTVYVSLQDHRMAERYYRKSLKQDPKSATVLKNLGTDLLVRHKYKQGGQYYAAAMAIDPHIFDSSSAIRIENGASLEGRGAMNYYMAKTCVRAGMKDRAVEYLRLALNEGFTNPKKIVSDSEFSSLHGLPAFEQMLAAQKTQ